MADDTVRLAVWSGPRNISTALMRSWENRDDTLVIDEPLYAHYLAVTGLDHPGRDDVIRSGETDWRKVIATLLGPVPEGIKVSYQKHMTHHLLPGIGREWLVDLSNVVLIRDPNEVVASYTMTRTDVTAEDIGLPQQVRLYDDLLAAGAVPLVIDSRDLLHCPERYLRALCDRLGLEFSEQMLAWPPGRRESDGVWAPHWYEAVWQSTGFAPYRPRDIQLEGRAAAVAAECTPMYRRLHEARWVL